MSSKEIELNVQNIFINFSKEEFIFNFLMAYGISKTSVTRLKKGDFNLSKQPGEVLYKKKVFFKEEVKNMLLSSIETLSKDDRIVKHSPRFTILTDYSTLVAKDLKTGRNLDISFSELPKYFDFFLPLAGSEVYNTSNDNKADRDAAYKMAQLYDILISNNPDVYINKESVHHLNIFFSRLLFLFFAEDTNIFPEESVFTNTLAQHTLADGSDVHIFLNDLFKRLNTNCNSSFPDYLSRFPFVNGNLFNDSVNSPLFTAKSRKILLELGELNWKEINPDIFGSMIQAVVLPDLRSDLGMHYTSLENIHKLIRPLFLDSLYEDFENATSEKQLRSIILRLSKIKFFDPACGSGNFLIVIYKEIRKLEIEILKKIIELNGSVLFVESSIRLDHFFGIEIDDFAHEMAILSLWIAVHQMNEYFAEQLDGYTTPKTIIPLEKTGTVIKGNATQIDWNEVCPTNNDDEVYLIGNPPYLGARLQEEKQKDDMSKVFYGIKGANNLDYISCWFYKASHYIKDKKIQAAFVSTNSICQGEQVCLLWPHILKLNIEIGFAYHSFKWTNNAKRNAGVTVIIISLRNKIDKNKFIFHDNIRKKVININPYLIDYKDLIIYPRSSPISKLPEINFGSMPNDGGYLLLSDDERKDMVFADERSSRFIRAFSGGSEYINGERKYCLWITEHTYQEALKIDKIAQRIDNVRIHRINSKREATNNLVSKPYSFGEVRHKDTDSIIIPATSSERREYIPVGFLDRDTIISNSSMVIYNVEPWHFSVVTSKMHMVWVSIVSGRLKTDYRYSAKLSYNTFPFPEISLKQRENLNIYVLAILDERAKYPEKTLAQLYDPEIMPLGLKKAHKELDEAVDKCYRLQPFNSDTERLEYLFKMYEEMIASGDLFSNKRKSLKRNK